MHLDEHFEKNFKLSKEQSGDVYFYHSEDDFAVPFDHLSKYNESIPEANYRDFKDKNHFIQAIIPELIVDIKS